LTAKNSPNDTYIHIYIDFWSLGILLFELLTRKTPFAHDNIVRLHSHVCMYVCAILIIIPSIVSVRL